jgi:hypothetical protein
VAQTTSEAHLRPAVRCIPSADKVLLARAANALDLVGAGATPDGVAVRLESILMAWYPRIKVMPIEPLATDHGEQAWYVYRDGT